VAVGEHLDLDMARLLDEFFDEDPVIAEGRARPPISSGRSPRGPPSSFQAIRMPLPPPPADALIITG
jgi:hypothetical protein